jgi:hypothetical protein
MHKHSSGEGHRISQTMTAQAYLETNVSRVEHRRNYPEVSPAAAFEEVWQNSSRDAPSMPLAAE